MDVLTLLIFFIVMMSSVDKLVTVPANPLQSGKADAASQPTFALKVTVLGDNAIKVYLGPVNTLDIQNRGALAAYLKKEFKGSDAGGFEAKLVEKDKEALLTRLRGVLLHLKASFPHEMRAVVAFGGKVKYQTSIDTLAAVRSLPESGAPISIDVGGKQVLTRVLFPSVVVAEWSEE
jgi:hypothetical protein